MTLVRHALDVLHATRAALLRQQWFTTRVLPAIPRPLRWSLWRLYFLPSDVADRLSGRKDQLLPPKSRIFTGSVDDFKWSGEAVAQRLIEHGGLTPPRSAVLDVNRQISRITISLTGYLSEGGRYEGLDVVQDGINWCQGNIATKFPNFRCTLADAFTNEYHPHGKVAAKDHRFRYPDNAFDVAVLTSGFTHTFPTQVEHYTSETVRVLRPGARCYITHLLINEISKAAMKSGSSTIRFKHYIPPYWLVDDKVPELSVGYDANYVRELHARHSLNQEFRVLYGTWSGRSLQGPTPDFAQDIVLATLNKS